MALLQLKPPEPFNFKTPDQWIRWIKRFQQFREASGLSEENESKQISTLLYCMGEEAEDVLSSTSPTEGEMARYEEVIKKFDTFFKVRKNVIFERARFNRRNQLEGETAEQYITQLYQLADNCEYPASIKNEMIRDRLVVGILDTALSETLQLDAELTLETAKKKIRQKEAVKQQQQILKPNSGHQETLEEIKSRRPHRQPSRYMNRNQGAKPKQLPHNSRKLSSSHCNRCGKESHSRSTCPAKDSVCHNCHKRGHYSAVCFAVKKNVSEVTSSVIDDNCFDSAYLDTLTSRSHETTWIVQVELEGQELRFKMDTGAEVTAITGQAYSAIGRPHLENSNKALYGPAYQTLKVQGQFKGRFSHKGAVIVQTVYVIEGLKNNLLGLPAMSAMNLIARTDAIHANCPQEWKERFPSVFSGLGTLGSMYEIQLKPDAKPVSLFTARHIPIPLRSKVSKELDRMETLGVISKVDQPTPWCAGIVVVPKKNGSIRICVDLKPLNVHVLREVHPLPSVDDTLAQLAGAKIFSKLDANSGFWQVPLSPNSKLLTTFITPFGRYCFNKLPFGIASAPEVFQKRMNNLLQGLEGTLCLIDDILVFSKDYQEHEKRLSLVLQTLQKAGVTLNWDKCRFFEQQVTFLGHLIDQDGIKPDPSKTTAIIQMCPPKNVTELRRFLGMVNQLGKFSINLSELSHPLRKLLSKKEVWQWTHSQEQAFDAIKQELSKSGTLALYDPASKTKVSADASSYGLGAAIFQFQEDNWKPVAYASRAMSETEQRYAQIEKEALAATWACEKFASYLLGLDFIIETDHKPLVPLLGMKTLDSLPPRILRFRLRLDRFRYSIVHVPGKLMYTADTLSRAPISMSINTNLQELAEMFIEHCVAHLPASEGRIEVYRKAQIEDQTCAKVIQYCKHGWPRKVKIEDKLRAYWKLRNELTVFKDLLLLGKRIVVPLSLQRETLLKIHEGHQGIERCRLRARQAVWWPEMSQQIKDYVAQCQLCAKEVIPSREPLIVSELPDFPWQRIATDLFMLEQINYLLVVDYFSRYPEIVKLTSTSSHHVITALKAIFSRHGIPEVVVSDNGPQYTSKEFKEFAVSYDFTHITSSPHYPQSNGQAERTVRTIKKLLQLSDDPYMALLSYRSTPFPWCNLSPSELLMGRPLRTTLPCTSRQFIPEWRYLQQFRICNSRYKEQQKDNFDNRHRVRNLSPLPDGTTVWISTNDKKSTGTVSTRSDFPRSYIVDTSSGQLRRNRRHLTTIPNSEPLQEPVEQSTPRSPVQTRSRTNTIVKPPDRFIPGREM